jgi:putative two-component system hydrogenase maturation factor HypX/HoxX
MLNILLFATAYNGMCQRVDRELQRDGHRVYIELSPTASVMEATAALVDPDLIICPFLKHRVPDAICRNAPA